MIKGQDKEYITVCAFMTLGKTVVCQERSDVWDFDFGLYRQLMACGRESVPNWVRRSYAIDLMAGGDRFRYVCTNEPYICQSYLEDCVFVVPSYDEHVFEQRLRERAPDDTIDMHLVSNFDRSVRDWRRVATSCDFPVIITDKLSKALKWLDGNAPNKGSVITIA